MESIYLLIPISILLVFAIAGIFWWSVRSGQFDDLEGPGFRILMDDDERPPPPPPPPPVSTPDETDNSKNI
jgi:cbb3-type cytochrome oxidase maturation protein